MKDPLQRVLDRLGLPGPGPEPGLGNPETWVPSPGLAGWVQVDGGGRVAAITLASSGELAKSRLLAAALGALHPEIDLYVVLLDSLPAGASEVGFGSARLVPIENLGIYRLDFLRLELGPVELAEVAKPVACLAVAALGYAKVVYFDSDFGLYGRLDALLAALCRDPFVVVPRRLSPPDPAWGESAHRALGPLGTSLFGFVPEDSSRSLLGRWRDALQDPGAFLPPVGQNAFDWWNRFPAPVTVLRDAAYGGARGNLNERSLRWSGLDGDEGEVGTWRVDGRPLVAFSFAGLSFDDPWLADPATGHPTFYLLPSLAALTAERMRCLEQQGLLEDRCRAYSFDRLPGGIRLDARLRRVVQRHAHHFRRDLDPFTALGEDVYGRLFWQPAPGTFRIPALLWEIYLERPDLQMHFPEARIQPERLIAWFCSEGAAELGYGPLLDRFRPTLPRREAVLHLYQLIEASPSAFGDLKAPLGKDRPTFIERLEQAGYSSEARGVVGLDAEIWAPSRLEAVRRLVSSRPDLRCAFPDYLGVHLEDLADWLENDGVRDHGLTPGHGELLRSKGHGRALGRIYSSYRRHRWFQELYPFAYVGEKSEELAMAMLERWPADCEFDLDDIAMFLWEMAERPWLGMGATCEAPIHAGRQPSPLLPAGRRALLAPFLGNAQFRRHLDAWQSRIEKPENAAELHLLRAASGEPSVLASQPHPLASVFSGPASGINGFGYFRSPIGLGNFSWGLVRALESVGFEVARQVMSMPEMDRDLRLEDFLGTFRHDFTTNLFVSYPHLHTRLLDFLPSCSVRGHRNIVYLAWEQRDHHPFWREVFADFDQIWAISDFAAGALRRATGREVLAVPAVVDFEAMPPKAEKMEVGLEPDRCTFLYVFDANSSIERKNPGAAIAAFACAFRPGEKVELLIKVGSGQRLEHRRELLRLVEAASATGLRIRFETRHLPRRDLLRLISAADGYVSLHRSEGFGYTCAEAMAYGVPVIATGYSGNLEFMDAASSFLVRYDEVEVEAPEGPFQRGSVWAEPSIEHAAELMRQVYEEKETALAVGKRGAIRVRERLGLERIAGLLTRALRR